MIDDLLAQLGPDASEDVLCSLVEAVATDVPTVEQIAELARCLAASGEVIGGRAHHDVASTGGPSSLSTLLAPLYMRATGRTVASLGVPGRPAGAIDVLATVPGFRAELDRQEAEAALATAGIVHLIAGPRWAPLDARLFALRQRVGAQSNHVFATASILAKKLAVGVGVVGLDIRVSAYGNFGSDIQAARRNAEVFSETAAALSLRSCCVVTDGSVPYQGYVGRGEALCALLDAVDGVATGWLAAHGRDCRAMAAATIGCTIDDVPQTGLREALTQLLEAHGASEEALRRRTAEVRATPRTLVGAPASGFVRYDLQRLRDALVSLNAGRSGWGDVAGAMLLAAPWQPVERGDPVISVRAPSDGEDGAFERSFSVCQTPYEPEPTTVVSGPSSTGTDSS